jgi:hypothetical protein
MLVQKLRIFAMIMRLQELEQERVKLTHINNRIRAAMDHRIYTITDDKLLWPQEKEFLFDPPKSKYIDKPIRNYKR